MRNILLVALVLATTCTFSFAQDADNKTGAYIAPYADNTTATDLPIPSFDGKVIANIVLDNVSALNMVVIEKGSQSLFTVELDNNSYTIIDADHIMQGSNRKDKLIEGDNNTPEGLYYIVDYVSGKSLVKKYGPYAEIYGAGSLPLNYPNKIDRQLKKTGHGIWLHGRDDSVFERKETQGCVALTNPDFETLKEIVTAKHPVLITENLTYMTTDEYAQHRTETLAKFDSFINSWATSYAETYRTHIHPDFGNRKNGGYAYTDRKISLMNAYPKRTITTDNTKIFTDDNQNYVVDTNLFYAAPNITSYTNKRYYFMLSDNGTMQLINEETFAKDSTPIVDAEVNKFIDEWLVAWTAKDMEGYKSFYNQEFRAGNANYNSWMSNKERLFAQDTGIAIRASNRKWKKLSNGRYSVSFIQEYSSASLTDIGVKTLILSGFPTNFQIISETWVAQ